MLFPLAGTPFSLYPEITFPVLGQLKHFLTFLDYIKFLFKTPLLCCTLYDYLDSFPHHTRKQAVFSPLHPQCSTGQAHSRMSVTTGEKHKQFKWGRVRELLCNTGEYLKQALNKRIKTFNTPKTNYIHLY